MAKKTKRTWKPTIGAKLGPQERVVRNRLELKGAKDVLVSVLFRMATGVTIDNPRRMQQRIGAIAARHNKKVKSPHIVAGDKPGTYRLKRVR